MITAFDRWSGELESLDTMGIWQDKLDYYRDRVAIPVAPPSDSSDQPAEDEKTEDPEETTANPDNPADE